MTALDAVWTQGWQTTTTSARATQKLATQLAKQLHPGCIIGLVGDLGAGKTCFVQGLAKGLGALDLSQVVSPTYTYINEYPLLRGFLVHIDFYRLHDIQAAKSLGIDEQLHRQDAVVVVEWANQLASLMPAHTIWIKLAAATLKHRHCVINGLNAPPA